MFFNNEYRTHNHENQFQIIDKNENNKIEGNIMVDNVYKIAIAAFLHDVGKFAQCAEFGVDDEHMGKNASAYQPFSQELGLHTHLHSAYTAEFIKKYNNLLPERVINDNSSSTDDLITISAAHHLPQTPNQWIIAIANKLSIGVNLNEISQDNNETIDTKPENRRLLPIFEQIDYKSDNEKKETSQFQHEFTLNQLSPQNIFPIIKKEAKTDNKEYRNLFDAFIKSLKELNHKMNTQLWFEHFDSLLMIYTSQVPALNDRNIPDISLYEHSKVTAAIATALYIYHNRTNKLDLDSIKNHQEKKFMLINGNFYGIQSYIFSEGKSTNKAAAKILRGRSFMVSLLTELAADLLCREIGLPVSSIVLNNAGKFTILAPNITSINKKIENVEQIINSWLIEYTFGETSIGLTNIEASASDFESNNFGKLWEQLFIKTEEKKYKKFDIVTHGGVVEDYLEKFKNHLKSPLCPFCGKRPSSEDVTTEELKSLIKDAECACKICRDQIYFGTKIVKKGRVAVTTIDADLFKDKLMEPIYGKYQITLDVHKNLKALSDKNQLLKYWEIIIPNTDNFKTDITLKLISNYVPLYNKENKDFFEKRLNFSNKTEKSKAELEEISHEGVPISFNHISISALNEVTDSDDKFYGTEALGVLKADIDNLGLIFASGLNPLNIGLSKFSTLSSQLNNFFTLFLPHFLKTEEQFNNIYTVFGGGDDLFLVGPWNKILDFSLCLYKKFKEYVCNNSMITLSAGISLNKPGEPVISLARRAEDALEVSKGKPHKDSITIFGECVKWDEFETLIAIKDKLLKWKQEGIINNAMLYKLNMLVHDVKTEKAILANKKNISVDEIECFKWRSRFKYNVVRNAGQKLKKTERDEVIEKVLEAAKWLEKHGGKFKIPLWSVIYDQRGGKNE